MSIQYVNIGSNPNDGTGDDLRSAFLKVNDNFEFLVKLGGETNYGTNLGGGDGEVYAGKTLESLNFRTIAAGTGITVNQNGTTITIASSFSPPASITKIYDQNNTPYETSTPGASLKIKGAGFVTTQLSGNEMTINGAFSVVQDQTPLLGGDLNLNGFDISGLGNIANTGSITTDTLTVGRSGGVGNYPGVATIDGTLTVNGSTTLAALNASSITTTSGITAQSFTTTSGIFTGDLQGDTTGTHYGNLVVNGLGAVPDQVVINTAGGASIPAVITGSHFGDFSGNFTGSLIAPGIDMNGQNISGVGTITLDGTYTPNNMVLTVNGVYHGGDQTLTELPTVEQGAGSTLLNMKQQTFGFSEALRIRSTSLNSDQVMPLGSGIRFESVNNIDINDPTYPGHTPLAPEFLLHGYVGVLNYDNGLQSTSDCSSFVVKVRTGDAIAENYLRDVIVAQGDGKVSISNLKIEAAVISPKDDEAFGGGAVGPMPFDLVLTNKSVDHYINFYGEYDLNNLEEGNATGVNGTGYSFPKTIGAPGEVLTAQAGTNLLYWSLPGGGGGGGATSLLNLSDVPDTYSGAPGKLLRVNATGNGIEFVNAFSADVTGNLTGNASTATALQNTRTINGFDFNGTQNVVIDTRQIEELRQVASNAAVAGSSGTPVTTTTVTVMESNLTVNAGELSTNQGYRKFRTGMYLRGTNIVDPVITNISMNAGTGQNDRLITFTITFEEQVVGSQSGVTITGEVSNQWFNSTKARTAFSVTPGSALSYTEATGVFTLNDSVANSNDTLVKRNSSGYVYFNKAYVSTLEKNSGDTAITFISPVSTNSTITSSANITTSATVSAGFITLTGTGNQTLASTAQLILNPGTYVDVSGKKITNLSTVAPTNNSDAATKKYVDDTTGAVQTASFQELNVAGQSGGTIALSKTDTLNIVGVSGGNIVTSTTATGVQINLKSTISGITIDGNLPVSGNITGSTTKGGNIKLEGNSVLQTITGSDLNLIPGSTGGAVVISDADFKLVNSRLSMTGFDVMEFSKNTLSQQISLTTQTTFIRTISWTDDGAGLAFAELPNGQTGQIKIIIMSDRGTYGNALDTQPRHLVLSGNINGSSRTVNIAAVDANGSSTFIFLNNYWWRIANVA